MSVFQTNFLGEGFLGLFGFATDSYCLISNRLSDKKINQVSEKLGVETIESSIFDFSLSGILSAGNSRSVLVPYLVKDSEVEKIEKTVPVVTVPDKFTALGNLIAANDSGGIISDVFSQKAKVIIDEALGINTVQGKIAHSSEVGALCLATNKGFVVSPDVSDEELSRLEKIFGVPGGRASVNTGSKVVGACLIANSNGLLAGEETTPIEMEYIIEALGFL
jgi:translation initiation factor 6